MKRFSLSAPLSRIKKEGRKVSDAFGRLNSNNPRAVYNALRTEAQNPGVIVTESYLRLEQVLGTQSIITFDYNQNVGTPRVTERRLAISDSFQVTQIGFYLSNPSSTPGELGRTRLFTYPNQYVFTGATEADQLREIYNGFLSIRLGSTVFYDSLDMRRFMYIKTSQRLTSYISPAATTAQIQEDEAEGSSGLMNVTPSFELSGTGKANIQITLPDPSNMAAAAVGTNNVAVLYFRGFLKQNYSAFGDQARVLSR